MQTSRAGRRRWTPLRIIGGIGIGLLGLVVLLVAVVYAGSQWKLSQTHDVALAQLRSPVATASAAEGHRLTAIFGCRACHGIDGTGHYMEKNPVFGDLIAPAFAATVPGYSDDQLARLIRHGVRADGTGIVVMPSENMVDIADDDVAAIVAWLRTTKPGPSDIVGRSAFGPVGRALILTGAIGSQVIPADRASPLHRPADIGVYFYQTACADCHALDHERPSPNGEGHAVPALAAAASGYDLAAFTKLFRTGLGQGGRNLGLMTEVAQTAGSGLTDAEIAAIHAYLLREAAKLS